MCDFSGRLLAWLDRELPKGDAAEVERHLQLCAQCRARASAYQRASAALDAYGDAYFDALMASTPRRKLRYWVPVASGTVAAAAAIAVLFLIPPRARVRQPLASTPPPMATAGVVSQAVPTVQPTLASAVRRRHVLAPPRDQGETSPPAEPAVEIAIPADAVFPPGAIPAGVSFTAEVTIAPDGSAQQIRLRPQLAGFERRTTPP